MSRTTSAILLTLGVLLLAAGVIFGFVPQGACGSPFAPSSGFRFACSNQLVGPRIAAFVGVGLGIVGILAAVIGLTRPRSSAA